MPRPTKKKPLLIIEEGRQKYTTEKIQSAGITMEIIPNDGSLQTRLEGLPLIQGKYADVVIYLMGGMDFIEKAKTMILKCGFHGEVHREFTDEDECMTALGFRFPDTVTEKVKTGVRKSLLAWEICELGDPGTPSEELAAVAIAAEELRGYQISPATPENIRCALIAKTKKYLHDSSRAEAAVDVFLERKAKKLK